MGLNSAEKSAAPPPYSLEPSADGGLVNQTQGLLLSGLDVDTPLPTLHKTIAHLKLLHAIQALRNKVSSEDGLYGIKDNCNITYGADDEMLQAIRAKLAEKRWAVFVAQAVDRFTVWWDMLKIQKDIKSLRLAQMQPVIGEMSDMVMHPPKIKLSWTEGLMPPIGKKF